MREISNSNKNQNQIQRRKRVKTTVDRVPFTGLPRDLWIKFKYYQGQYKWELNNLNPMRRDVLSLNDPYDPYTAIGGKSANEFQQLMRLYKYCRTYKADVDINIIQEEFANRKNIVAAMLPNYDNNNITSVDDLISQDPTILTLSEAPVSNLVQDRLNLRRSYDISTVLGMSQSQYANHVPSSTLDVYNSGSLFYSPTLLAKLDVYVAMLYDRGETITAVGDVTVIFHCKLTQKIYQGESDNINPMTGKTTEIDLTKVISTKG